MDQPHWLQLLAWGAAIATALFAVVRFNIELRENRAQRQRELRWSQAEAAKKIMDEMQSSDLVQDAFSILDYNTARKSKRSVRVDEKDYLKSLAVTNDNADDFIRKAFDEVFYYMAILEHYLDSSLVLFEDIQFPLDYYVSIMNRNRRVFDDYLEHYRLRRAKAFFHRMVANQSP